MSVVRSLTWPQRADDESGAGGVVAGYRIFRNGAVELNYLNLGALKRRETWRIGFPPPAYTIDVAHELETTGPVLSALGILPLSDRWEIYLRAGVLVADMKSSTRFANSESSVTFGSEALLWGGGMQFNWGDHWSIRLDFQRFQQVGEENAVGVADIDLLPLGVLFRL